nr:MAG TPA: hypothetical protein [Caudoviricetes sp.]
MILNRNIISNDILKSNILKERAFTLSHGTMDISMEDGNDVAILKLKDDRFSFFQLTIDKYVLDSLDIKKVIIDNIFFTRNTRLDLKVHSNSGTLPIINNSSEKVYLRNWDILTGDIQLPNVRISLSEPAPQGALTFDKNGIIYKDKFADSIWEYIEGVVSNITSIDHGKLGGFYIPIGYFSLEYMYEALKNEETLQQFQSHMPHLDSFSFLFQVLNDIVKVHLDFKNPDNNRLIIP